MQLRATLKNAIAEKIILARGRSLFHLASLADIHLIYAANGGNSGKPYFENEPNNGLDLRNGDLRINLEKRQIVRVGESSGGFKITFDEWGHMY